jgi:regulator of replication initiation timing
MTTDDLLRQFIGDLVIKITVLQAENTRLSAELDKLRKDLETAKTDLRTRDMENYIHNTAIPGV